MSGVHYVTQMQPLKNTVYDEANTVYVITMYSNASSHTNETSAPIQQTKQQCFTHVALYINNAIH